ncbi:MAG: RNA chaperone ProQ [Vibrionaceae bacterium]
MTGIKMEHQEVDNQEVKNVQAAVVAEENGAEKLKTGKQIIEFLAERFPLCFTLEGEAKPLKIGIFKDLTQRLADCDQLSKTQLRASLRLYTSSWRYLHGMRENAQRIDLDGNFCGELELEHVEHAKLALAQSKERFSQKRKQNNSKLSAENEQLPKKTNKIRTNAGKSKPLAQKNTKLTATPKSPAAVLKAEEIIVGKNVNINMGSGNMSATIVEINKDDVRVRLTNGLTMVVKMEHLRP